MAKLDLNLAVRPFINERPLRNVIIAVGVLIALATFANVHSLFSALVESRALSARLTAERAQSALAREETEALAAAVSERERKRLRAVAASMTAIIKKRRLSWSRLFDELEAVLPRDVRVLQISPDIRDDRILLLMECHARDNQAKLDFYGKLHEAPFSDAYILSETIDEKKIRFSVKCHYEPQVAISEAAPEGSRPGGRVTRPGRSAASNDPGPSSGAESGAAGGPSGGGIEHAALGGEP